MSSVFLGVILLIVFLLLWHLAVRYLRRRRYKVPFVPSTPACITALVGDLQLNAGDVFIDIGCGDGAVLSAVANAFPGVRTIGYEISTLPYTLALQNCKALPACTVVQSDYFTASFVDAGVIYCYMLPHHVRRIRAKMQCECAPGTLLYTYRFALTAVTPIQILQPTNTSSFFLYKYAV